MVIWYLQDRQYVLLFWRIEMTTKKSSVITCKMTPEERTLYEREAISQGFAFNKKKANFSKYVRWILEHGQKPLDRERYNEFIKLNQDYARLGNLFNQFIFHLNREYKILVDKGLEHENNRNLVDGIVTAQERFEPLADLTYELQSLLLQILKKEA